MIKTCSQMHRTDKYPQQSSIIWPVWINGWVFVYELSGCGFESSCSHLNFKFRVCFEQGVSWHWGNYSVWIHSETRTWTYRHYFIMFLLFLYNWFILFNSAQIFIPNTEHVIPTGSPTYEVNAKTETQLVTVETKMSKCST